MREGGVIDPSVRAVLRSRYTIRHFFSVYSLILIGVVVALLALTCLDPNSTLRTVFTNLLSSFGATVAIVLVTYTFYVWVTPPGMRNAEVLPLRSGEIADGIVDLRTDTSEYWFWGRSGTYFRAAVLPKLDELAQEQRKHITVKLVIPDPTPANSSRYACMRRGLRESADERTLPANVLATVIAIILASSRNPYLHARIGLCPTVPVLRYDISTSGALITRDARGLPAILVNSSNPYFEMFRDAVENELAQSREIKWQSDALSLRQDGKLTIQQVLSAIDGLPDFDQDVIDQAEQLLHSREHRYAG